MLGAMGNRMGRPGKPRPCGIGAALDCCTTVCGPRRSMSLASKHRRSVLHPLGFLRVGAWIPERRLRHSYIDPLSKPRDVPRPNAPFARGVRPGLDGLTSQSCLGREGNGHTFAIIVTINTICRMIAPCRVEPIMIIYWLLKQK